MHRHPVVLGVRPRHRASPSWAPSPSARRRTPPPPKTPRQRSRRPPRRAGTSPVWSTSAAARSTWSATARAVPPSSSRPATARRPATGATICSTPTRRGRWSCPPWRSSPASAPTTARGPTPASARTIFVSRSDAIAQPRTAPEVVADLHALLQAAEVPGPYVLAAHSLGGLFARLYASTYPDEVVGLVLVDAYSERLESLMPPEQLGGPGAAQSRVRHGQGHPDSGLRRCRDVALGRGQRGRARGGRGVTAAADAPGRPRPWPAVPAAGGRAGVHRPASWKRSCGRRTRTWPPSSRTRASSWPAESGHDIHQDQPELVTEAIRQVVAGVRNPDTWYDLTSCCAE